MAKRKRDYKKEYAQRIARGVAKGYNKRVARGHARKPGKDYEKRRAKAIEKGISPHDKRWPKKSKAAPELSITEAKNVSAEFDVKVKPGSNIRKAVLKDSLYVFGRRIRRGKIDLKRKGQGYDDGSPSEYQMRLAELQQRYDGVFDWTNEAHFVEQMKALGLTEREAYSNWFSPGAK